MNQQIQFLFHIKRLEKPSLIIHGLETQKDVVTSFRTLSIEGRYGADPTSTGTSQIRNTLYEVLEKSLALYVSDASFLLSFSLSAVAFLVVYLFFSIVVKDPLPMIDELILGLLSATVTYLLLEKRAKTTPKVSAIRIELKTKVDSVFFEESSFVRKVEELIEKAERLGFEKSIDSFESPLEFKLTEGEAVEAKQFLQGLEVQEKKSFCTNEIAILKALNKGSEKELKKIQKKIERNKVDYSLLYAISRIRKSL